jgi:hypothetical protein
MAGLCLSIIILISMGGRVGVLGAIVMYEGLGGVFLSHTRLIVTDK